MTEFNQQQKKAIAANGGHFLVLAPPGCGKTAILAERIAIAHEQGVPFSEMLCLTFTNRASRSMKERVAQRVSSDTSELFVGNIHRFCSSYLFDHQLLPANASIIDEDDQADIMQYFDSPFFLNRYGVADRKKVKEISDLKDYIRQRQFGHPQEVLKGANNRQGIYSRFEEFYQKAIEIEFDPDRIDNADYWKRLKYALQYQQYKKERLFVDFSDLLVDTYEALRHEEEGKKYRWIQVDEVQDLGALQIAIVDQLTSPENFTVMYLGDEQQAIYSFLGAKLDSLLFLRKRCEGNLLTLSANYRSPAHLINVFNTYAQNVLHVDSEILPTATEEDEVSPNDLILALSPSAEDELARMVRMVNYYLQFEGETTAILVSTNAEADRIGDLLDMHHIRNFRVSGKDLFKTQDFKTFASFLSVMVNEFNTIAWIRLVAGLGIVNRLTDARQLINKLRNHFLSPLDLLRNKPYVVDFLECYNSEEMVYFDTETTGLNTFEDDIVQIAAFKVRNGEKVEGSNFNIILQTDKTIPPMLGDKVNPLVEEYAHREHIGRKEGLQKFLDYIGDCSLLGHNVNYDHEILRHNILRDLGKEVYFRTFDTLKLIKYIRPNLKRYKLEYLLAHLGLEGENSHLADDDIEATKNLADFCVDEINAKLTEIQRYWALPQLKTIIEKLQPTASLMEGIQSIFELPIKEVSHGLADIMESLYKAMISKGMIAPMGHKFDCFLTLVRTTWTDDPSVFTIRDLIASHIIEMTASLNEGDLLQTLDPQSDRLIVTTVHKGKGLEFDNVIVYNVVDNVYPSYYCQRVINNPQSTSAELDNAKEESMESARKLYVALTRAKKRICISYSLTSQFHPTSLSPFVVPIQHLFRH